MAGACMVGCVAGGMAWQGACVAGEMATAADGTHPTGVHSCFLSMCQIKTTKSKILGSGLTQIKKILSFHKRSRTQILIKNVFHILL